MKPVRVELDGKERNLKFDFNAMSDFESVMGFSLFQAMQNMGIGTIRALYWAGLKHKEKGLTLDRVGKMLTKEFQNGQELDDLIKPIIEALEESGIIPKGSMDDLDEEDEEDDESEGEAKNG